ncbi:DNA-binding protein WhiA [Sinanaerobacter chloroacetimidivorans]|jgi:DNA-binding protein WhiA|uniref:Probable cell division protein WhiA n=1 Tax=Sinanaerobacter chloroacetimidivorans TaxID=2818044 RepID=A0A8J8B2Y9_9FIRM|nr:DNA-binding protein WhiA [Sinanaerobacter chloroacetimidivorans]MBR0600338.1 DNA-binding protein WhiA [Sinanaerobacter chloroacetimidivorans]
MSFSANTKNELSRTESERKCCKLAEIAGFIRMCGTIKLSGGGKINVKLLTENPAAARHFKRLIKDYFGINAKLIIAKASILKKGHFYELIIESEMNAEQILRETGILLVREGCNYISDGIFSDIIKTKCCKRAYLRGVFLGAGTISDPEKGYHLEIVCNSEVLSSDVRKLINSFGLKSKVVTRKKSFVVYLKEAEQIIDFLNILGAHGQLLDFENIRILKEMRNKTNRINNCDSANLDKTINASAKQLESIMLIEETRGIASLPDKLYETARLRMENPEASLIELAEMLDPPIGKSGINHRLKKIEEIAEKIRLMQNENIK